MYFFRICAHGAAMHGAPHFDTGKNGASTIAERASALTTRRLARGQTTTRPFSTDDLFIFNLVNLDSQLTETYNVCLPLARALMLNARYAL